MNRLRNYIISVSVESCSEEDKILICLCFNKSTPLDVIEELKLQLPLVESENIILNSTCSSLDIKFILSTNKSICIDFIHSIK